MVRRAKNRAAALESSFPIRVRIAWDRGALPGVILAIEAWGLENLGFGRMAATYAGHGTEREALLYFRSLIEAEQCLAAFPETEFIDFCEQDRSRCFTGRTAAAHSTWGE